MKNVVVIFYLLCLTTLPPLIGEARAADSSKRPHRNPFRPVESPTAAPYYGDRPLLERYPLSMLKLTAIVTNASGELFASVETPYGIGCKVVKGVVLGDAGARVLEISKSGILIEEQEEPMLVREIPLHPTPPPHPTLSALTSQRRVSGRSSK